MKNIVIYTLVDPRDNQVRYIGKTNNIKQRLCSHINRSRSGFKCPVHYWIRKLLSLNLRPTIHVQEVCNSDNWEDREAYWIDYYRSKYKNLTNVSDGGISPLKNSEYRKEVYSKKTFRKVHQYDLNGVYICSYGNGSIAAKALGIDRRGIERCLKGNSRSSRGFYWSYIKQDTISIPEKKASSTMFKIGIVPHNKGKKTPADIRRKLALKKMRRIVHIETGEVYESLKEAAEKNNIPYGTLTCQFFHKSKTLKFKNYEE